MKNLISSQRPYYIHSSLLFKLFAMIKVFLKQYQLKIPILITKRLVMKPFKSEHSLGLFELLSSAEVCKYSGSAYDLVGKPIQLPAQTTSDSDKVLDFFIQHQSRSVRFRWAILSKSNNEFLGAIGFNSLGACSEIAYHLIPRFCGQGFMAEACKEAIHWVNASFGSTSIEAFIDFENISSIKLVKKLNFKATGESNDGADRYLHDIKFNKSYEKDFFHLDIEA